MAGRAPLWSGAMSPSARLLFSAAARCSLQPGPVLAAQVAHALLPSPLPLTPLLPLFSFIHPIPFLFLDEREMLGELRYLAGIRCELGKTALPWSQCLAPCAGPLGAGPQVQAPQVWVPRCGTPWRRLPRSRPWAMLSHVSRKCLDLCVQSLVGDWAASTGRGGMKSGMQD